MLLVVDTASSATALAARLVREGVPARAQPACEPPVVVVTPRNDEARAWSSLPGVVEVLDGRAPTWSVRSARHPARRVVHVGAVAFGGSAIPIIAGPCSVDDDDRLERLAGAVRRAGAAALRAGVTKARSGPWSYEGRGVQALPLVRDVGRRHGLPVVSEVLAVDDVELFAAQVDMLQIGARNMQNAPLLRAVGRTHTPVLLKRGFGTTVDELLFAADTVLAEGNRNVVLCERGIRTFEGGVRFSLDLSALALLLERSCLPVVVDPSHAAGRASLVPAIARAAVAAGADGLLIEVHDAPHDALSDGQQAISPATLTTLSKQLGGIAEALGRSLHAPASLHTRPEAA